MKCAVCGTDLMAQGTRVFCPRCQIPGPEDFWRRLYVLSGAEIALVGKYDKILSFLELMYSEDMFSDLTPEEHEAVTLACDAAGISRDRVSADCYRRCLGRVRELVEEMLRGATGQPGD